MIPVDERNIDGYQSNLHKLLPSLAKKKSIWRYGFSHLLLKPESNYLIGHNFFLNSITLWRYPPLLEI